MPALTIFFSLVQDYDVLADYNAEDNTDVTFAYKKTGGIGQHSNANRGAASVSFATGLSTTVGCTTVESGDLPPSTFCVATKRALLSQATEVRFRLGYARFNRVMDRAQQE